jgi:hypothetical protein
MMGAGASRPNNRPAATAAGAVLLTQGNQMHDYAAPQDLLERDAG